jgi:hypothetical protein
MRILKLLITGLFICICLLAQSTGDVPPDHVPGRLIVHHNGHPSDPSAALAFARHGARVRRQLEKLNASVIEVAPGTEETVMQSLRSNPLFREVELDHYARPAATPNDPSFSSQWHLAKIQAPAAWDITTGSSTPIAVLDSGVDTSHPDLAGRLMPGWNFVNNSSNVSDTTGHGTAVTGVIGALTNNGAGVSAGVWQNPILPLVVVDSSNYASYSNIAAAIQYATDHGARVISLSVGGSAASSILQNAVNYAWNAGAIVVAAAMNNSSSTPFYPAACTNAIAVSASDENDNLAGFSDYGSWITLAAPGTNIVTTTSGGGYGAWQGTSLSTPVVSSVAALALAANPSLTAQALVNLMEQNADDIGSPGYDTSFGWGRVNAYRTVLAARGGSVPAPPPTPTPTPVPATLSGPPYRIHSGGGAVADASGLGWSADGDYSGGSTWSTASGIAATASPNLYQTCRYGNFTYTLPVSNGSYTVTLKFAEISRTGPGQRQFNVAINGNSVLSNFDVFAQAGGANIALDKSFPVTVTGGQISIQFTTGASDLPLVNAIDVETGGTVSYTSSNTARVHAGGGSYTDSAGRVWSADTNYSGGTPYSVSYSIGNTATPALYQTCRYGNFSYSFAVPNGNYSVTLKFAELSRFGAGLRVFNVALNGSPVLSNFDIYSQAGGALIALDKTFPVSVSGGVISLMFTSTGQDLPLVNSIDIEPASSTASVSGVLLNAGAGSFTDAGGQVWAADNSFSGGATWSSGAGIANTPSPALYRTCRYGAFGYAFSLPNGNYSVTLKFAEIALWGPGQRAFNVSINGAQVLSNFDIFAQAGGANTAIDKTFPVTVSGGQLSIQFTNGFANLPMVNALEITPMF